MKVGSKSEVSLESQVRKNFQFTLKTFVFCLKVFSYGNASQCQRGVNTPSDGKRTHFETKLRMNGFVAQ